MARMGYVTGQGLGKRSDGRAEPVPIQLLPQGKSLSPSNTDTLLFRSLWSSPHHIVRFHL